MYQLLLLLLVNYPSNNITGDTAEIESISKVFCGDKREQSIYVGSVKASIGHLEGASGIAGLIKAVMVLKEIRSLCNMDSSQRNRG